MARTVFIFWFPWLKVLSQNETTLFQIPANWTPVIFCTVELILFSSWRNAICLLSWDESLVTAVLSTSGPLRVEGVLQVLRFAKWVAATYLSYAKNKHLCSSENCSSSDKSLPKVSASCKPRGSLRTYWSALCWDLYWIIGTILSWWDQRTFWQFAALELAFYIKHIKSLCSSEAHRLQNIAPAHVSNHASIHPSTNMYWSLDVRCYDNKWQHQ